MMIAVLAVANILTIGADLNSIAAFLHIFTGIKLELLKNTLIPHIHFENAWITAAPGLLGTTISPCMLF